MKTFLFPGQGSQARGMGGALFDEYREWVRKADDILGYSIRELCLEDSKKKLNQTQFTQPALYVVNALSYFKKIDESGQKPDYVAGHSLGEFNALLAAECFDFETGLTLVRKRGECMSQASGGGMAAILNAGKEDIETILTENGLTQIDLANFNTPSQIVISGPEDEIEKAESHFNYGKVRFHRLNTSGAFHSRHMQSAKEEFDAALAKVTFSECRIPVIANITASPYQDSEIAANLSKQLTGSVKWSESILYLMNLGDMAFEEIGHGRMLTQMVDKIRKETPPAQTATITQTAPLLTADEKVRQWNQNHPVGTRIRSAIIKEEVLETNSPALVLFGHRAAVYMKQYNGYFDLNEVTPC